MDETVALIIYLVLGTNLLYRILIRAFQGWRLHLGMIVEYAALLALFAWLFLTGPGLSGAVVLLAVLAFLLVLPLPWALQRVSAAMAVQRAYAPARVLALLAWLLAWSRENLFLYQFYTGLALYDSGQVEEAERYFDGVIRSMPSDELRSAAVAQLVQIHTIGRRWRHAADVHERFGRTFQGELAAETLSQLVRAHAEVGRFDRALECQERLEERPGAAETAVLGRIFLFALAGRPDLVRLAFADRSEVVEEWPRCLCPYWIGRAHLASGQYEEARVLFRQALEEVPRRALAWRRAVEEQLRLAESPTPPLPKHVDPEIHDRMRRVATRPVRAAGPPPFASFARQRRFHPVTSGLLGAAILVFLVTNALSGEGNPYVLMRFGAMVRSFLAQGEHWRFVTQRFVHGGLLHILANGYMLYVLGNLLEDFYGARRILFVYVVSGLGGAALSIGVQSYQVPMVGASGAIMGLLGCGIAFAVRHERHIPGRQRRFMIFNFVLVFALILGSRFLFDRLSTGGVKIDNWAHLGGGVTGLFLALFLTPERFLEHRSKTARTALAVATAATVLVLAWGAIGLAVNLARGGYPRREVAMEAIPSHRSITLEIPRSWKILEGDASSRDYLVHAVEPWAFPGIASLDVEIGRDQTAEDTFAAFHARYVESLGDGEGFDRPDQRGAPVEIGGRTFFLYARSYTLEIEPAQFSIPMVQRFYFLRTEEGVPLIFVFAFRGDLEDDYQALIHRILASVRRG